MASPHPASLAEIVAACNQELQIPTVPDYGNALNGLQLANRSGTVGRIVTAVDACLPVIREAVAAKAQLLIVHHGLFWSGLQRIDGAVFEKIRLAVENDLAIYSAHIPLDVHASLGNNACLASALGFHNLRPFFAWKGIQLGLRTTIDLTRDALMSQLSSVLGRPPHLCPGGPETIREVGIVTGGAGSEIAQAALEGVDTFITGEGPHWSYTLAEELGVNLIYGGHYATETFGVRALADWIEARYGIPHRFLDHPSGL